MNSKIVCKVMVSVGILQCDSVIRECNTDGKILIIISKGKIIKKLLERAEILEAIH